MSEIVGIGELLIDMTPCGVTEDGRKLFSENPGGAVPNTLVMASKLGASAALIGKVGNDSFGRYLLKELNSYGVSIDMMRLADDKYTTVAIVQLDERKDRSFSIYRELTSKYFLSPDELDYSRLAGVKALYYGAVPISGEPSKTAVSAAADHARNNGAPIFYDPNFRDHIWSNMNDAVSDMCEASKMADVIKLSVEEMTMLTGETELETGAKKLFEISDAALLFITLGEHGAYFDNGCARGIVEAYKMDVKDTTGAGDAFLGTVLYQLKGCKRSELKVFDTQKLKRITKLANAAGALTTLGYGAIPSLPSRAEIEKLAGLEILT